MKTVILQISVFLLLCYVCDCGAASVLTAFPRQQDNHGMHAGNSTLTFFEKIRRLKEAFRDMIRMKFDELRTASTGVGLKPNGTQPLQGQHLAPNVHQTAAGVPTNHLQPTGAAGTPRVQPGGQIPAKTMAQQAAPQSVPLAQPVGVTAPMAQPGAATAPMAQPGAATAPMAQPGGATAPMGQPVFGTNPVPQQQEFVNPPVEQALQNF